VLALLNQLQGLSLHYDTPGSNSATRGLGLGGDIDHVSLAGLIEMG
jgi:hypothetical protein